MVVESELCSGDLFFDLGVTEMSKAIEAAVEEDAQWCSVGQLDLLLDNTRVPADDGVDLGVTEDCHR